MAILMFRLHHHAALFWRLVIEVNRSSAPVSTTTSAEGVDAHDRLLPISRLEAFSGGVFAIAITLLVIELHMPTGHEPLVKGLKHEWPRYLGYFVSFAFIGGVWIAHSNMTRFLKAADPELQTFRLQHWGSQEFEDLLAEAGFTSTLATADYQDAFTPGPANHTWTFQAAAPPARSGSELHPLTSAHPAPAVFPHDRDGLSVRADHARPAARGGSFHPLAAHIGG